MNRFGSAVSILVILHHRTLLILQLYNLCFRYRIQIWTCVIETKSSSHWPPSFILASRKREGRDNAVVGVQFVLKRWKGFDNTGFLPTYSINIRHKKGINVHFSSNSIDTLFTVNYSGLLV